MSLGKENMLMNEEIDAYIQKKASKTILELAKRIGDISRNTERMASDQHEILKLLKKLTKE